MAPMASVDGRYVGPLQPGDAEQIVEALRRNGVPHAYLPFEGEGHGFRRRESLVRLYSAWVSFFSQVFGFDPADDVEQIEIVGH
jgi:hypothetical protein